MTTKQEQNLETKLDKIQSNNKKSNLKGRYDQIVDYLKGCVNPENARLYGNFQERAALNITQFPKIQGSLLVRMGMVYPLISYLVEEMGVPKDAQTEIGGMVINYHTWIAGYFAYLTEIQLGLSKYPIEFAMNSAKKLKNLFTSKQQKA